MRELLRRCKIGFLNLKMAQKLCLFYASLLILSLFLVYEINGYIYKRDMQSSTEALFAQVTTSCETLMDDMIVDMDALSKAPLYLTDIQEELRQGRTLSSESIQNLNYFLSIISIEERYKYVISLYNADGQLSFFSTTTTNSYIAKDYYDLWYEAAEQYGGAVCIVGFDGETPSFSCTVTRLIKNTTSFQDVGLIAVSIPDSKFSEACAAIEKVSGSRAVILDSFGSVMYDTGVEDGAEVPAEILSYAGQSSGTEVIDSESYLGYCAVRNGGKYTVLIYAERDKLMANLVKTQKVMRLLMAAVLVTSAVITVLISGSVTKPLRKITRLMETVQKGDWSVRFDAKYRGEIGILGLNFNVMLEKMNEMLEKIIMVSTSKKQVEIDALQSQINPHFMYNTLETFRMMAVEKDCYELADLIYCFGKMLRYNITTINEMTTIANEIEYLENYIHIQNSRYGNRFALEVEVANDARSCRMIKLLIQPIVENAIFHGLEMQKDGPGTVKLRIYHDESKCYIDISDNGIGIPREKLDELRKSLKQRYGDTATKKNLGLRNVNERIQLFYGEEYGISIDSTENSGTIVRLTMPYSIDNRGER